MAKPKSLQKKYIVSALYKAKNVRTLRTNKTYKSQIKLLFLNTKITIICIIRTTDGYYLHVASK